MYVKSFANDDCRVYDFKRRSDGRADNDSALAFRASAKAALKESLRGVSELDGWSLGECIILDDAHKMAVFEVFDKERRDYWLCCGPWHQWQLVSDLWAHLDSVNRVMLKVSPLFQAFGPMLPEVRWLKAEEGFVGVAERRSDKPFLEYLQNGDNPFRFENVVQMAGFLLFLQSGYGDFSNKSDLDACETLAVRTAALIEEVEGRVPRTPRFSRWKSFLMQNVRSVSCMGSLALSLGVYAPRCFAYAESSALLVDYPFLLSVDFLHMDLCRILFEMRTRDPQDLKCLIDVYFDRNVPSYFFAQLALYQTVTALKKLASSVSGSSRERNAFKEFENLSHIYEQFRTPVPLWYK